MSTQRATKPIGKSRARWHNVAMAFDYSPKFEKFRNRTLYERLDGEEREVIRALAFAYRFTFQEFRQVAEAARDLALWGQGGLAKWYEGQGAGVARGGPNGAAKKERFLRDLQSHLAGLRHRPVGYSLEGATAPAERPHKPVVTERSDKRIFGMCPVASEKTVCCNLHTIDAVENCVFGCSYCSVQTFYRDSIVFDADFARKLDALPIEAGRFYHIGTGQASDALAWGNRGGILDALCRFAARHPHVLLEFKTKSDNVRYFVENDAPPNVVCSWSLNTPVVIANEEHFTADLDQRVGAARTLADRGMKVAFHFHPMVNYEGWDREYPRVASMLMDRFSPEEVAFVSFGSVTLIKPVIDKVRWLGNPTHILQAELVPDPHGKLTYPDAVKTRLFGTMRDAFAGWHDRVFMYLCMEKASIWRESFGYVYNSNSEFESDFGRQTMAKLSA
jgi:spore photoproduct lyase